MDDLAKALVFGIIVPIVLTLPAAIPWTPRRPRRTETGRLKRDALAARLPVLLGASAAVAFVGVNGSPTEKWESVLWVIAGATGLGVVSSFLPRAVWVTIGIGVAVGGGALALIWPVFTDAEPMWLRFALAGGTAVLWITLELVARRVSGAVLPFALAGAVGGAAIVIQSGFMTLAVPTGALATSLTALAIVGLRHRGLLLADGAMCVVAPVLGVAPMIGYLYIMSDEVSPLAFVLPAVAPLALLVLMIPLCRRPLPAVLAALMTIAVAGAGVALAFTGSSSPSSDESDEAAMYGY